LNLAGPASLRIPGELKIPIEIHIELKISGKINYGYTNKTQWWRTPLSGAGVLVYFDLPIQPDLF